jgi:hypothetical protein
MRLLRVQSRRRLVLSAGPLAAQTLLIYQIDAEQAVAASLALPNGSPS